MLVPRNAAGQLGCVLTSIAHPSAIHFLGRILLWQTGDGDQIDGQCGVDVAAQERGQLLPLDVRGAFGRRQVPPRYKSWEDQLAVRINLLLVQTLERRG
jgi:hypothetical protein